MNRPPETIVERALPDRLRSKQKPGKSFHRFCALLLALLAIIVSWQAWAAGVHPDMLGESAVESALSASGAATAGVQANQGSRSQEVSDLPEDLRSAADNQLAAVHVVLRYKSDNSIAAGIPVSLVRPEQGLSRGRAPYCEFTDRDGSAVIHDILPGAVLIQVPMAPERPLTLSPGAFPHIDILLTDSIVSGTVFEPSGARAAFAEIWVSTNLKDPRTGLGSAPGLGTFGAVRCVANADGFYSVRLAIKDALAAFKPGFGASNIVFPLMGKASSGQGAQADLWLQHSPGRVYISVVGAGSPIKTANVTVGHECPQSLGGNNASPPAWRACTGQDGVVEMDTVPPGEWPLLVTAGGWAPYVGSILVPASGDCRCTVTMLDQAVVEGTVADSDGRPLSAAIVRMGDGFSGAAVVTTSSHSGAFTLTGLPGGLGVLVASHPDWGTVSKELVLVAGQKATWNPRMSPRASIVGECVYSDGYKVSAGGVVMAYSKTATRRTATSPVGVDGRFALAPLDPGHAYSLRAEIDCASGGMVVGAVTDVVPGAQPVIIKVVDDVGSRSTLRGRVVFSSGAPAQGCALQITPCHGSLSTIVGLNAAGEFTFCGKTEGGVVLAVLRPPEGAPIALAGPFAMAPGVLADAGDITVNQPGGVVVRVPQVLGSQSAASLYGFGRLLDIKRVHQGLVAWPELAPPCQRERDTRSCSV